MVGRSYLNLPVGRSCPKLPWGGHGQLWWGDHAQLWCGGHAQLWWGGHTPNCGGEVMPNCGGEIMASYGGEVMDLPEFTRSTHRLDLRGRDLLWQLEC